MAVSNTTTFSLNATELVSAALELLGVKPEEEALTAVALQRGLLWLNLMLKAWEVDGVMGWTLTEGSFALVQSDADYDFGPGGVFTTIPVDIQDARINRGGNDLPMTRLSRADYFDLPNKATEGYPTQYFYDRQREGGTFYVWPAPDATGGTIRFTYRRRIMDMVSGTDDFDLPQEWFNAVVYGLAEKLIPIYGKSGTPRGDKIESEAAKAYNSVRSFDMDEGESSLFVVPASYARAR